jgi:hypothetical protein
MREVTVVREEPASGDFGSWFLTNLAILAGIAGIVLFVSALLDPGAEGEGFAVTPLGDALRETLYYGILVFGPLILAGSLPYLVLVWLSAGRDARFGRLIAIGLSPLCVSAFYVLLYPGDGALAPASLAIAAVYGFTVRLAPRLEHGRTAVGASR